MTSHVIERAPLMFVESPTATSFLDYLPGMLYRCSCDPEKYMYSVTEGCFELTGYTSTELLGNSVCYEDIIFAEDRTSVWTQVQAAVQQHIPYELVYRIKTRQNQVKWVRENGQGIYDNTGNVESLEGFITDITDLKNAEIKIQQQTQQLESLHTIDMAISSSFDLRLVLNILLEQITIQLNVDAADCLLSKPETGNLEYATGRGFRNQVLRHNYPYMRDSLAGKAVTNREIIHIPDLRDVPGKLTLSKPFPDEGFITYFGIPLIAKGQVKGVLELFHRSPKEVDVDWMTFLETISGYAAITIDNAILLDGLQKSNIELMLAYDATLEGLVKALEYREHKTEDHSQRVIDMTLRLAKILGIEDDQLEHIRRGALLHDIGKMGIPDSILQKQGSLTQDERVILQQHPIHAHKLLSSIDYLRPAIPIPYCHHENWDGTGYPNRLIGEQIPLPARIFAVINVWEALISDRSYRKAWTPQEALAYLAEQSGKMFDPRVTEAFFLLVQEHLILK